MLDRHQQLMLCDAITDQEVYDGLCGIGDDKSPGLDGYNAYFFKKAWSIIGKQITGAVLDYFDTGQLNKGVNCTTITLVPKVPNPTTIKDYRPIACCTVLKHISLRCMIKIDVKKAYDSVEWPYLDQVMEGLGFPTKFRDWIFGCVKMVNYSIVISGESTKPFKEDKQFKYHPRCGKLGITHLSFSDDLLLFTRGDHKLVVEIQERFLIFSKASGLQANLNKSSVYLGGVEDTKKDLIMRQLGYADGELPFRYLGIPLDTKKLKTTQ
ncbi:uncharacterized protein LOC132608212 [Lycium barbarum]|uniref:uncharacterized protein LOC132608212 n=1 Tax=Lycium barbarum TaxID=112863 RepID=UPI00293EB3D1|nr:uncharacterized protein LOC132608212 [Lycium barbarum]